MRRHRIRFCWRGELRRWMRSNGGRRVSRRTPLTTEKVSGSSQEGTLIVHFLIFFMYTGGFGVVVLEKRHEGDQNFL